MKEVVFQRTVIDMAHPLLDLWIPGQPLPKARARVVNGHAYTPARTLAAEDAAAWEMLSVCRKPLEDPLMVQAVFYRKGKRKADLDNLLKLVLDAANGVVWHDDSQVTALGADVVYERSEPGTRFQVWELR